MSDEPEIALRGAGPEDAQLLFELYAGTREQEMTLAGLDERQAEAFLKQQHMLREAHYAEHFPADRPQIVVLNGNSAGRLYVHENGSTFQLVDIALLPAWRGRGVGTRLIQQLQHEAAGQGKPIELHVDMNNPTAQRLYTRMGFVVTGIEPPYIRMAWSAEAR
jgi:ribosomal protein S18 acetylase RimI-like enzyme